MANIIDYIKWRGDLSFQSDPFNDIDGLVFSLLVYVDFGELLPGYLNNCCRLEDLAEAFFKVNNFDELMKKFSFTKESIVLLKTIAQTNRYKDVLLLDYVNELDYQLIKQFAAMTFRLPDGTLFVSYRGTDDTILGWKEDLMMSYLPLIPSQVRAKEYLEMIAKKYYKNSLSSLFKNKSKATNFMIIKEYLFQCLHGSKIRIGGHSKGGNLAVYATCNCNDKILKRITTVYNNDGPGFDLQQAELKNYQQICNKVKKFVPEGCIFGIMLEYLEEMAIVKSDSKGLLQHNAFSWQIEGNHFVLSKNLNDDSQVMDLTFKSWLLKVDKETRKQAVESIFEIFEATEIKRINDLSEKTFMHLLKAIKELKNMDGDSRNAVICFFKTLFIENNNSRKEYKKK